VKSTAVTGEALDVEARHFVHKLYEATGREGTQWHVLYEMGIDAATVWRAVERGWVVLQAVSGNPLKRSAALTEQGRQLHCDGSHGLSKRAGVVF
jgi:hypothetical protein